MDKVPVILAIVLVVNSSYGRNLVFHYPYRPNEVGSSSSSNSKYRRPVNRQSSLGSAVDTDDQSDTWSTSSSSSRRSDTSLDDLSSIRPGTTNKTATSHYSDDINRSVQDIDRYEETDDEDAIEAEESDVGEDNYLRLDAATTILGFKAADLANILSPHPKCYNEDFEVAIDHFSFIGKPVQVSTQSSHFQKVSASQAKEQTDDSGKTRQESANGSATSMTMFNVVLVLQTPVDVDYREGFDILQHNVLRKLSSRLRREQAKSGYVWKEVSKILHLKETSLKPPAQTLWNSIMESSNLARALSLLFDSLVGHSIAQLDINSKPLSLQIPIPSVIERLPPVGSKSKVIGPNGKPPLLATMLGSVGWIDEDDPDPLKSPYYSLLLLDTPENIIRDVPNAENTIFSTFVSFLQIAHNLSLTAAEVSLLSYHLIHWRRARAIPPLHHRQMYMVSPIANLSQISKQSEEFSRLFPLLPTLPRFLAALSARAQPFMNLIPRTSDHRGVYMEALMWLMSEGWIAQFRTFAWIVVTSKIKQSVFNDELTAASSSSSQQAGSSRETPARTYSMEDEILKDPYKASSIERKWILKIASSKPSDVAALFQRLVKYFNGRDALEKIGPREGITRKEVRGVIRALEANGEIVQVVHW